MKDNEKPFEGKRFLVVDDSSLHVMMISSFLENLGAAVVKSASSGEEAMDALASDAFDAALVDLHMINMNGIEFARRVRKNPEWVKMRLVLVTADGEAAEKEAAMDLFDASISKALITKDLVQAILGR